MHASRTPPPSSTPFALTFEPSADCIFRPSAIPLYTIMSDAIPITHASSNTPNRLLLDAIHSSLKIMAQG